MCLYQVNQAIVVDCFYITTFFLSTFFVCSAEGFVRGLLHLFVTSRGERGGGERGSGASPGLLRSGGGAEASRLQVCTSHAHHVCILPVSPWLSACCAACLPPLRRASAKQRLRQQLQEIQ